MARVELAVTKITRAGANVATVAGSDQGQSFRNNGKTFLEVENVGAAQRTLTIVTTSTVLGLDVSDLTVDIAAGAMARIGPFPQSDFNNAGVDASLVYINFPAGNEADLHVAAYTF